MRLAPPPLDITDDEGFERDIFQAKEAGERLANVVTDLEGHSVVVLDGDWGTGKTTFIRQWAGLLRTNGGHPVVYLDAFASDHLSDPFFAMLAQFLDHFDQRELKDLSATLATAAKGVLRAIPAVAARRLLPIVTGGVVSLADFEGLKTSLKDANSDPAEDWLSERIEAARSEAASIRQFKKVLGDMVENATMDSSSPPTASESGEEVPSRGLRKAPLIFIIDELDRCRPSFALSVLERMKHVFSANGVCFVLATNLEELTAMVKHTYGLAHPERYLEKFYHLRVDIEPLLSHSRIERRGRYLEHLTETMGAPALFNNDHARAMISELAQVHDLHLRSLERVALCLALYDRTARHRIRDLTERHGTSQFGVTVTNQRGQTPMTILREHGDATFVAGLCVMRICEPALYRVAASGRLTFEDAKEFFKFDVWEDQNAPKAEESGWGRVTIEGPSEQESGWTPTMAPGQMLASICQHIDLFWQDQRV